MIKLNKCANAIKSPFGYYKIWITECFLISAHQIPWTVLAKPFIWI